MGSNEDSDESTTAKYLANFNKVYPPVNHDIKKDEIGGLEQILDKLEDFKAGVEHPQMFEYMGITPPNGFIFAGPPGTGKTYVAKYLSNSLGTRFVDLPLQKFESKYVGEAEKKLSSALKSMRLYHKITNQKILLFFDEAEEAFKNRQSEGYHGPRVNVLLREMDGMGDSQGIIFGAATNHLDKVDDALLRSGRLDYIIRMPEYDSKALTDVITATQKRLNRKAPHHNPYELTVEYIPKLGELAAKKNLLPADISEVFRLAGQKKVREMIESDKDLFTSNMTSIKGYEIRDIISSYDKKEKSIDKIGF